MSDPAHESLTRLAAIFAARGLRWYLFGAQAVILHGHPRHTADLDITLELGDAPVRPLLDELAAAGFTGKFTLDDEFIRRARVIPLIDARNDLPVDLVLSGPGLEEQFLSRAEPVTVGAGRFPVICLEDLLVVKVLAGRGKDLDDALALLRARQGGYNRKQIITTLRLLEQAIDSSELVRQFEALESAATK